jgi:putative IMPACT (imprinted ancient) family translation regulator
MLTGTSAQDAISVANIIEKEITEKYLIPCGYERHPELYRILRTM